MRKLLSLTLVAALAATLLAGCGGGTSSSAPAPAPSGDAPSASTPAPAPAGQKIDLKFATGGTSGSYYPYGGAMGPIINAACPDITLSVQSTGASVANIRLIANGEADIAIVQNDTMQYAYTGTVVLEGEKIDNFRTMATCYAETCQIIAADGITSIDQLKGKRVSVGDAGSGTEANAMQILEAYGITFDDIKVQNLGFGDSATAMKDNKIDAFFVTAGPPTTAVMELTSTNKVNILSIEDDKIAEIIKKYPYYTEYTIKGGTYKGTDDDKKTVAVKATLIVNPNLSEDVVYRMTKALIEGQPALAAANPKGAELSAETAVQGVSVPFHPGAEKYFREIGVLK